MCWSCRVMRQLFCYGKEPKSGLLRDLVDSIIWFCEKEQQMWKNEQEHSKKCMLINIWQCYSKKNKSVKEEKLWRDWLQWEWALFSECCFWQDVVHQKSSRAAEIPDLRSKSSSYGGRFLLKQGRRKYATILWRIIRTLRLSMSGMWTMTRET